MNIHKNARLTPHSRAELVRRVVEEQQSRQAVALAVAFAPCSASAHPGRLTSLGG